MGIQLNAVERASAVYVLTETKKKKSKVRIPFGNCLSEWRRN